MELVYHVNKRPGKKPCDRCGVNRTNIRCWLASPSNAHDADSRKLPHDRSWKGQRYRRAYMSTLYLCLDCFVEVGNDIAKAWMKAITDISKDKTLKIENIDHMKSLAELKHERAKFSKIIKEQKVEQLQLKRKERNTGLNVVGIV